MELEQWSADLSGVMGSARGTYTPDAVLLLNSISPKELENLWKKSQMPEVPNNFIDNDCKEVGINIRNFLSSHGIAIYSLKMDKGRDGMQKFDTLLAFHFRKNKFEKINFDKMKVLGKNDKK